MTMEITIYQQLTLFFHSLDHLLRMVNSWVQFLVWINPLSIQINLSKIASIIANNNTINIKHGYNFKQKVLPQHLRDTGIAQ
jgi:hypothetical protein